MYEFPRTKQGNSYEKKYNISVPTHPPIKILSIQNTNNFNVPIFCQKTWEKRINKLKRIFHNYTHLPDEIWCIILKFQMYMECCDKKQYYDWLYSDYSSKKTISGMVLRSRKLYMPNIVGIVLNEGTRIVKSVERATAAKKRDKKRMIENISKEFLNYIVKWFHWMNNCSGMNHLVYALKIKSVDFMDTEHYVNYTHKAYVNFYCAEYYINVYYQNYLWGTMSYKDIDFEYYIFSNKYYNIVYKKAMQLRNYKRINIFLHE
tara:strand:- start:310 stop:1092 length:783 start_codon:yes stop_codon:yes gene_type:complete